MKEIPRLSQTFILAAEGSQEPFVVTKLPDGKNNLPKFGHMRTETPCRFPSKEKATQELAKLISNIQAEVASGRNVVESTFKWQVICVWQQSDKLHLPVYCQQEIANKEEKESDIWH